MKRWIPMEFRKIQSEDYNNCAKNLNQVKEFIKIITNKTSMV